MSNNNDSAAKPELLPCPCGAPAVRDDTGNHSPESVVRCTTCTFAAFITDWNRRVQPQIESNDSAAATQLHRDIQSVVYLYRTWVSVIGELVRPDEKAWARMSELDAAVDALALHAQPANIEAGNLAEYQRGLQDSRRLICRFCSSPIYPAPRRIEGSVRWWHCMSADESWKYLCEAGPIMTKEAHNES